MSLKGIAKETLAIAERGHYIGPNGQTVRIGVSQRKAESETRLYDPEASARLLDEGPPSGGPPPRIEVTGESSQAAAKRLVEAGATDLVLLNFASARNPGGGFLNGAKAQEEDLARCSGLYLCQLEAPEYYRVNRAQKSLLYTDHLIYSPGVPFFRVRNRELLEAPFEAAVITAPAPNAGQVLRRDASAKAKIEACYRRRAGMVLAIAQAHGHRTLLLGAWGCGVFRNDPAVAARIFGDWLKAPRFAGAFDAVTFAVMDPKGTGANYQAFAAAFAAG